MQPLLFWTRHGKSGAVANAPERPEVHNRLTKNEAGLLFSNLSEFRSLALAVSGGSDSLALLYLFNNWRLRTGWSGDVLVFTVDHRLRAESAAEADMVKGHCAGLGLSHETLIWGGEKPASNIQAEARAARYRLMAGEMKRRGIEALLLAHHRDDQVETFLDRLTRGSGVYGLGGMAPDQSNGPSGIHLIRPLLEVPKARLTAELVARGISWAEDPSNEKADYKRVRLRAIAADLAQEGLEPGRLLETAKRLRRAGAAIDDWVNTVWSKKVEEHPAGPLKISFEALSCLPEEVRLRLLAQMILRASGRELPLRLAKLEALAARISDGEGQSTLAGTVVRYEGDTVFVWREAGRSLPECKALNVGAEGIWDERYSYSLAVEDAVRGDCPAVLGPLSAAPVAQVEIQWPQDWPKACFACSPAVWHKDTLLSIKGLPFGGENAGSPGFDILRLPERFGPSVWKETKNPTS